MSKSPIAPDLSHDDLRRGMDQTFETYKVFGTRNGHIGLRGQFTAYGVDYNVRFDLILGDDARFHHDGYGFIDRADNFQAATPAARKAFEKEIERLAGIVTERQNEAPFIDVRLYADVQHHRFGLDTAERDLAEARKVLAEASERREQFILGGISAEDKLAIHLGRSLRTRVETTY